MSEKPSTPSSEQSDKAKKYDRQLRLWGDHGQAALEASHICLINASAAGTETLKSLILPGIGAVTIVDSAKVSQADLGNNFFLDSSSIGSYRGATTLNNLLELNPDVRGTFVEHSVEEILSNQPDFFNSFTVVISTNLRESTLLLLSKKLWEADVPLVVVRSYGLIAYLRLQFAEHTIIESHPDNTMPDLRLDCAFSSLYNYIDGIDLNLMSDKEYSHTPYVIILFKYLEKWKKELGEEFPRNYREKKAFIEMIKNNMRENKSGEPYENFDEAFHSANVALVKTAIPSTVKSILKEAADMTPRPSTKSFWLMAKALEDFIKINGYLPVSGVIPDMTADSESYIKIQNIYRDQANIDADWIYRRVQEMCHQLGPRKSLISENDIKSFCKNAQFLRVVRGKSIEEEYKGSVSLGDLGNQLEDPDSHIVWYVMLRAVDQFYSEFRAYPGYFKDQVETDIVRLKVCINRLLTDWGYSFCLKEDYIHEICRYGAAEVHSVASYIGGCAAQEVIKLVTSQYIPVNNTFIYNAIDATSEVFNL